MFGISNPVAPPGTSGEYSTQESDVLWGHRYFVEDQSATLYSGSLDAGNTPTTLLRGGLVLAKRSDGQYTQYDPDGTDGYVNVAVAVLAFGVNMLDYSATAEARFVPVIVAGQVKAGNLIGLDYQARKQLARNFMFDDDHPGQGFSADKQQIAVTGNTTVTAAQNNSTFIVTGGSGVTFTLPTLAAGLCYEFNNCVNQNMVIAAASAGTLIILNDLAANSVAVQTTNEKIGGSFRVRALPDASKWFVQQLTCGSSTTVQTVTVVT